ncbi:uncharacterized protein F5147DRAFT_675250 [Suillus discolor]|uniref:Uncharacterized protein n=1 Tax=Suillus discolor TaxID=1912936 RepID=A0A9P7JYU4_9AGAM|nr:uncharacterized protein F5147DRAFT_675250 [Suillus discolor]KAG2115919.1 hypothetical protein F5147DRAFT_675250 [Suillus discolor]
MDVRENCLGRVIGCELRCIPPRYLKSCWGLKWCPKFYARGPSEFDVGVLTPDGKYNSLKTDDSLAMEHRAQGSIANLKPSPSLPITVYDADGRLGSRRREPPSSPSWHLPPSPAYSMNERTQDQPDFMRSPAHSSTPLIAPGGTERPSRLPIPITGSRTTLSSIQPFSEPYTSELSYALLPGHSSHPSQSCGAPTVGEPLHLHYLSSKVMPAVSQDPAAFRLLYGVAPETDASLEHLVSDPGDAQEQYLPPDSIHAHSTLQVHLMTPTMQTLQATLLDSWNNLDFSPASTTPMSCSTSFSADSSLIGEFEHHHGPGVATSMSELMGMDWENSTQSNDQLEAGITDEDWQLHRTFTRSSPMHQSRGLSPIDMSVDELPGTGDGEETAYNLSDTFLFSSAFHGTFAC